MRQLSHYSFSNAKIRAMLSFLLDRQELEAIMEARDLSSALDALSKTRYRAAVERVRGQENDIRKIEKELVIYDLAVYESVEKSLANKWEKEFVFLLRQRYELEELKVFIRLWHTKAKVPAEDYLISPKICFDIDFKKLLSSASIEDLILTLDGTPYKKALFNAREKYKELNSSFYLEAGLDIDYYRRLAACISHFSSVDRKIAGRILGVEADIENISWMIRLGKYYSLGIADVLEWLIPGGTWIKKEMIRKYHATNDLSKVVEGISVGPFVRIKELAEGSAALIEKLLYEVLYQQVKSAMSGFPFTIGTVMGYLFLKHRETKTIVSLLNAKNYGWDKEEITATISV